MKNLNIYLIILIFMCNSLLLKAQSYKTENIAVYNFNITSTDDISMNFNKNQRDSIYNSIIVTLTEAGLKFHPVDFLKPAFNYNEFDYPQHFEAKARKSNLSKLYAKIEVEFQNAGGFTTTSSKNVTVLGVGGGKEKIKTKIRCIIKIKVTDAAGKDVLKIKTTKESKERLSIETESIIFGRFVIQSNDQNNATENSLQYLVKETIIDLKNNIK